ncbi:hypothetical protein Hypma_001112 [Hypsizygus marmoreus]|uniref:Uncharacterized protein n=1 Tax=Hypsizygus marmoreus TaxID=39966 RepID=A0A369JAX6_HYPMA|nr:hypothetical protein Hypma_001112 [Hypsizygus marmoreus]
MTLTAVLLARPTNVGLIFISLPGCRRSQPRRVSASPLVQSCLRRFSPNCEACFSAGSPQFLALRHLGGRFSAIYGPEFIIGLAAVGIASIIDVFAVKGSMLFVIRALQRIGHAVTIPSAITMIVLLFLTRGEQGRALAVFRHASTEGGAWRFPIHRLVINVEFVPHQHHPEVLSICNLIIFEESCDNHNHSCFGRFDHINRNQIPENPPNLMFSCVGALMHGAYLYMYYRREGKSPLAVLSISLPS